MEKNPLYIKIDASPSVRKEILESAVLSAQITKSYEDYKKLREKKHERRLKLIATMKKIRGSLNTLKNRELPKIPSERKQQIEETVVKKEKVYVSDLDKEIMEIKKRLHDLED